MKKISKCAAVFLMTLIIVVSPVHAQFFSRLKETVKSHIEDKTDQKAADATDKTMDDAMNSNKKNDVNSAKIANTKSTDNDNNAMASNDKKTSLKVYSNYDFVPGDKILFEDHFTDDQDGEFPAHWELKDGQGLLNQIDGAPAFCLTEGNYVRVSPRLKSVSYLTDPFTVEFDYFVKDGGAYGINVFLESSNGNEAIVTFDGHGNISTGYFPKDFNADFPDKRAYENAFYNKWHHGCLIYKNNQLKCYVDQYRVLVMPSVDFTPVSLQFGGIGSLEEPVIFKNIRIASGGEMNMIGKKFTESKIVTHGINFDIDKATIRPESMGTLNMVVKVMNTNPDLKFEIDGHTDNTGDAAHNLTLSQERAEAVKTQLVSMGIDATRLTTKGFGDSKPISDNDTPEGKANNRRVEFVKI